MYVDSGHLSGEMSLSLVGLKIAIISISFGKIVEDNLQYLLLRMFGKIIMNNV